MELYLMRHGIAEDAPPGQSDSQRRLTDEGRLKAAAVVRLARKGGMNPELILSSPYLRALETAKIASEILEYTGEIPTSTAFVPHSSPQDLWKELQVYQGHSSVLLTSHEPLIGNTVGFLLNCPGLLVEVKKAGIFRIDLPSLRGLPRGNLQWAVTPKLS